MSRIGKKPVELPQGVSVALKGREITVKGPMGSSGMTIPDLAEVRVDEPARAVRVDRAGDSKQARANHGLTRALVANLVKGVSEGFQRRLLIYGTGYNCKVQGNTLELNIGYTGRNRGKGAQFQIPVPQGLEVVIETPAARGDTDPAKLLIRGCDKQQVGQFAAEIRALRKTEPYKGKGIRYDGEHVRRKQGKALAGGG